MHEFLADEIVDPTVFPREFDQFSRFLDLCVADPTAATTMLVARNIDTKIIGEIVTRYSKEARRLQVDLKQERERLVLSVRHRMEAELVDVAGDIPFDEIDMLIELAVPKTNSVSAVVLGPPVYGAKSVEQVTVNLNPQYINHVHGIVAQEVSGNQNFGVAANELLQLIEAHAGAKAGELVSAVYQLEDLDLKRGDRLSAGQRLKAFLSSLSDKTLGVGFGVIQSYIEHKLGL
jgi:hypothetical protein